MPNESQSVNSLVNFDASLRPTLSTLEDKLNELDRLKEKKAITEEEYKAMRDIAVQSTLAQSK